MTRAEKAELLREIGSERILVKDGPYGSMIQSYRLDEEGFRAGRSFNHDQKGNNDLLNLTRPDVVGEICNAYLDAGADIVATNTFNSNAISLSRLRHRRHDARDQHRRGQAHARLRRCRDGARPGQAALRRRARSAPPTRPCRCRPTSTIRATAPSPSTR